MAYKSIIRRRELKPNTFINGVGSTYTTAAQLAAIMTGINPADIRVFKNDGNRISCLILKDYVLVQNSFLNSSIFTFLDYGAFLLDTTNALQGSNNLFFHSKSVTEIGSVGLRRILKGTFYIPEVKDLTGTNKLKDSTGNLYTKHPNQTTNFLGTEISILDETPPDRIGATTVSNTGATFATLSFSDPASTNTLTYILVFINDLFFSFYPYSNTLLLLNIPSDNNNKVQLVMADEFFNLSLFSQKIITINPAVNPTALAVDAVANYPFNETTGDAIDTINGEDGTISGSVSRDGEYYTYAGDNAVVEVPNNANLNFVDGNGANVDFTIKTEFIATAFNSQNRFWLVSRIKQNVSGVRAWQLVYLAGRFSFNIVSDNNVDLFIQFSVDINFNKEYMVGVSKIGSNLFLNLNGEQVATAPVPNGFVFVNATSPMQLGNASFAADLNLIGKQKRTVILKGRGYTEQDWSDIYNGNNGINL